CHSRTIAINGKNKLLTSNMDPDTCVITDHTLGLVRVGSHISVTTEDCHERRSDYWRRTRGPFGSLEAASLGYTSSRGRSARWGDAFVLNAVGHIGLTGEAMFLPVQTRQLTLC